MLAVALAAVVAVYPVPDQHPHAAVRRVDVVTALDVWAEQLGRDGFDRYAAKNWSEADAAFTAALRLDPTRRRLLWGRALTLEAMGRYGDAANAYAHHLSFNPTCPDRWQDVALGWVLRGNVAEAEACFARALELCPSDDERFETLCVEAALWCGCSGRQRVPKTLRHSTGVVHLPADDLADLPPARMARAELAIGRALTQAVAGKCNSRADAYRTRAAFRFHLGRVGEAAADLDAALALNPTDADAHLHRGYLAGRSVDTAASLVHLDLAAWYGADPKQVSQARTDALTEAGMYAKAEEAAREWCQLDPKSEHAFRQHGNLLRLLGKDDEADGAAARAGELGGHGVIWEVMSQAKTMFDEYHQAALADRVFSRLLDRPGLTRATFAVVLANRAVFRSQNGQADDGFHESSVAVRLAPTSPNVLKMRIEVAQLAKQDAPAMDAARVLLRCWPDDPEAAELWRKCRGAEELRAGIAGREPDFRPPGPFLPVPIAVTSAGRLMGCVVCLQEWHR